MPGRQAGRPATTTTQSSFSCSSACSTSIRVRSYRSTHTLLAGALRCQIVYPVCQRTGMSMERGERMMAELTEWSIAEAAVQVQARKGSPVELTQEYLVRIE